MKCELRKKTRYKESGKVEISQICLFAGVLVDVSEHGCRVRFPAVLDADKDLDYEIKINFAKKEFSEPFVLIGNISWFENFNDFCEIGFKLLRSPSSKDFISYIKRIEKEMSVFNAETEFLQNLKNINSKDQNR
ncbi:MAG: PilZ domain-containing protein [Treponemataceae bacterium]